MITVFLCEDSLDGILTGVYDAWDSGYGHEQVRLDLEEGYGMELFCTCRRVRTDPVKAEKVLRTVARRMGREAEEAVCFAAACPEREKADAVYRLIVRGMSMSDGGRAVHCLQDPSVSLVMKLRQKAWHEAHRMMGFLRFEELENRVLYAQAEPACDILPLIAPHFADRFRQENWIIHDKKRTQAAVHRAGGGFFLADASFLTQEYLERHPQEKGFQMMWKAFCESAAIEERRNPSCQQRFLPLRFRPCMPEFQV